MMDTKKTPAAYRAVKWMVRAVFPKMQVEGLENIPEGGAIIVGNHAHVFGPFAVELYLGSNRYTWCDAGIMRLKEAPAYTFQNFWSMKPRWTHIFYRAVSYLIAPLCVLVFNNANTIPVYRDARVMTTFRQTVGFLREGKRIVIFPEHTVPRNNIVYDFQDRFIDTAKIYYNQTRRELSFVPMYTAPRLKKMILGKPIRYRPDAPLEQERRRICEELMEAVTQLGRAQPRHIVVPYAVIPHKDYPYSREP